MESILKARKGTAQYDEWLRKYREKRGTKSEESKHKVKSILEDKRSSSSDIENALADTSKVFDEELREKDWGAWYNATEEYTAKVAKALNDSCGINFKKSHDGHTVARLGEYESYAGGTSTIVRLDFDSGLRTSVDHSWSQSVSRDVKGGLVLCIEYPGYGGSGVSINLNEATPKQLKAISKSLREINSFKLKDVKPGKVNVQEQTTRHIKSVLNANRVFEKASYFDLSKAKKGTPEYAEWLRKYNEKRRKKIEFEETSSKQKKEESKQFKTSIPNSDQAKTAKSILEDKDTILASARNQAKHLDLFPQLSQDEQVIESTQVVDLVPAQDIRVAKQTQSAMAGVKVDGELLKATRQPVFANMFGHYPVEPIPFRERTVTSDYEQIDVALANEPDEITEGIWEDESWIATEKVDGCRCTLICTPEATRCTARRQQGVTKPPTDYTNNIPHIRDLDLYSILGDTIIDSEAVASNPIEVAPGKFGDSLSSTMSILGQEKDLSVCVDRMNKYGPIVNFCFDIQRFEGKDIRSLPYVERMKYLDEALDRIQKAYGTTYIKKVAVQKEGESKKDFFLRVVGNSGEGCVLAKADGPYKAFDRKNRLKAKRQLELTLEIMEVLEGVGRNAGSAGSFVMGARVNGQLVPIANLNVGSDELRKEAWENKTSFIGKCIEVKSMQMTLGSGKDGMPRLRHARWKTPGLLRTDKNTPDDLSETVAIMRKRRDTGKR